MSTKVRVLYVSQKLKPYLAEDFEADLCRTLPQLMQEKGMEIRTFMPRFGSINERRNQLHEVIRLSGKNIIINDADHQLVIKVASITSARMQVYFIDNDDYFHRKLELKDENGKYCADNDERVMFFGRGVLETITKLQWNPNIIHCNSWFSAITPALIKVMYNDNPLFVGSKIILSLFDEGFDGMFDVNFKQKLVEQGFSEADLEIITEPTYENFMRFTLKYCDGLILHGNNVSDDIIQYAKDMGVEIFNVTDQDDVANTYQQIYEKILNN